MRAAPLYRIHTWRQTHTRDGVLRFRPTWRTFLYRLPIMVICLAVAGTWEWGHHQLQHRLYDPVDYSTPPAQQRELDAEAERALESMREALGEEAVGRIESEAAARREQRAIAATDAADRANQMRRVLFFVHYGLLGFFLAIGIYAPLSCLWSRVTIFRSPRDELVISSFIVLPRTTRWPLDEFYAIRTFVKEHYQFTRRGLISYHGWAWYVQLSIKGRPQLPSHGIGGVMFGETSPQFHVYQEKHQPTMIDRAPEPVRELVKGLRAITGLKAEPPQLVEGRVVGRRRVAYSETIAEVENEPVSRQEHAFRPGDPIPDDLKAKIAGMTGDRVEDLPDGGRRTVSQSIVVEDEHGRKVTYGSIDELPPHIRKRLGL